jgi:hypothetical protein
VVLSLVIVFRGKWGIIFSDLHLEIRLAVACTFCDLVSDYPIHPRELVFFCQEEVHLLCMGG